MNEEMQIKIIDLMDDGATLESSTELKQLIDSSEEAQSFYESILAVSYTHLTLPTTTSV